MSKKYEFIFEEADWMQSEDDSIREIGKYDNIPLEQLQKEIKEELEQLKTAIAENN